MNIFSRFSQSILIIAFLLFFSSAPSFAAEWDIYYGIKGGIGFGGSIQQISLNEISPSDYPPLFTKQDRRGRFIALGYLAANFISPSNFGFEIETGYRMGGERVYDINDSRHSLRLHYLDLNIIGKYWVFGKLISAGFGVGFSYLLKPDMNGVQDYSNIGSFDITAIIKLSFNYWSIPNKLVAAAEISLFIGVIDILKNEARMNNVGVFFSFCFYLIHSTSGTSLGDFRY